MPTVLISPLLPREGFQDERENKFLTSPLSENGNAHVAAKTVDGRAVAEESAVVPPALVSTVHVEELLVLVKLELDPRRVGVAVAVVLGEHGSGLVLFVVDEEPPRRLGEEHAEEADQAGEQSLHPSDEPPVDRDLGQHVMFVV